MTSKRHSGPACRCTTLLFLSIILPMSSFAQITIPAFSTVPTSSPTIFQPSTTSRSSQSPSSNAPASTTQSNPPPVTPPVPPSDPDAVQDHVFNYYFLIIAVVGVLFCACILYIGRRKRRKAAMLRSQSQRALAIDVAGFRARFGNRGGRTAGGIYGLGSRVGRVDGLDERGEAPPPYVPGPKPPNIGGVTASNSAAQADRDGVELGDTTRASVNQPPRYDKHVEGGDLVGRRPDTAVTASE